jgi:hypothetical protein
MLELGASMVIGGFLLVLFGFWAIAKLEVGKHHVLFVLSLGSACIGMAMLIFGASLMVPSEVTSSPWFYYFRR